MKTLSPLNTLGSEDHSSQGESATLHSSASLVAGIAILLVTLVNGETAAEQFDSCRLTARAVLRSCRAATKSDYLLSLGKCDNLVGSAAEACEKQALASQKDAQQTCGEQYAARLAACSRLGGAPYDPVISRSNFVARVNNPYFPLVPGTTFIYEGHTAEGFEHDEFAVTHHSRVILGVRCVEVHDTVTLDGELSEDTFDWFAQDKEGNVWYFGENTHELEDGLITTIEGTFMAGVEGDKPEIVMKAHPAIGDFYRQEFSLNNAEDFAETVSLTTSVRVPAGSFPNCLKSKETTPLETDLLEYKFYARALETFWRLTPEPETESNSCRSGVNEAASTEDDLQSKQFRHVTIHLRDRFAVDPIGFVTLRADSFEEAVDHVIVFERHA